MTRSSHPCRSARAHVRRLGAVLAAAAMTLAACSDDSDTTASTAGGTTTEAGNGGTAGATSTDGVADTTQPADPVECATAPAPTADTVSMGGGTPATAPAAPAAPSPDDPAVTVQITLLPDSLDVLHVAGASIEQVLVENVYETLVELDDAGQLVPTLAESFDVSDDGLTYTFALREGVAFHNGDPLTAADVVWSLDQSRADDGEGFEAFATVDTVTAVDASTVEIALSGPDGFLLDKLTRAEGSILQAGATDLGSTANGTGPFTLGRFDTGASISLDRNDAYWGDVPAISGVTFVLIEDTNAALNALKAGAVDIVTTVGADLLAEIEGNPDFTVRVDSGDGEFTLAFNNRNEYLSDVRVRTAIRAAIDKEAILALTEGRGILINSPVPPHDPWFVDAEGPVFDPECARELLAEAGVPAGHVLRFRYPSFYEGLIPGLAEFVKGSLEDVGFTVQLELIEFPVWLEEVFGGDFDYDITGVIHVEPRDVWNYSNPDYYWGYDNPEVQALFDAATTAESFDESVEYLQQATEQIAADSPVDWLFLTQTVTASKSNVTGYPTKGTGTRFDAAEIVVG